MVEIKENYTIKNETTFRIGGIVSKVAFPKNTDEFIELLDTNEYDIVLGNCSNVLFSSNKTDKNIILTKNLDKYTIDGETVYVNCGAKGPVVSKACIENGLTGFEFLIGFPGSFGGMIRMNASAHNQSISDSFVSARVYNRNTHKIETINKEEMNFEYRNSKIGNNNYIIIDAIFKLKTSDINEIRQLAERNKIFRQERQPSLAFGNAGSIFKNPEHDSAGRLLDLCNLKGETEGGAKVYEKHANFIINFDNAKSSDVIRLMYKMYSKVEEKYTIKLRPEIIYIGEKETEEYKLWEIMTENIH